MLIDGGMRKGGGATARGNALSMQNPTAVAQSELLQQVMSEVEQAGKCLAKMKLLVLVLVPLLMASLVYHLLTAAEGRPVWCALLLLGHLGMLGYLLVCFLIAYQSAKSQRSALLLAQYLMEKERTVTAGQEAEPHVSSGNRCCGNER